MAAHSPGTDVALMLAWMRYIIDKDLYNHEFVTKWTNLPFLVNDTTKLTYRADELGAAATTSTWCGTTPPRA
ncbi:MAG: hypothetical protein ACLSDQ_03245 [Adlercreutzia equolifaciens]